MVLGNCWERERKIKDSGKIFVTNTKVGGTPAYYCEGQEELLQNLEKYLNEKERYAYDLLKEKKKFMMKK